MHMHMPVPSLSHAAPCLEGTSQIRYKTRTCSNNGDACELAVGQPFRPALKQRAVITAVVAAGTERVAFVPLFPLNAVNAFNAPSEFSAFSARAAPITIRHSRYASTLSLYFGVSCSGTFTCPLSADIMRDPVIIASGLTYERAFIEQWFAEGHMTCPKTRQRVEHTNLCPNVAVKKMITDWCLANRITLAPLEPPPSLDAVRGYAGEGRGRGGGSSGSGRRPPSAKSSADRQRPRGESRSSSRKAEAEEEQAEGGGMERRNSYDRGSEDERSSKSSVKKKGTDRDKREDDVPAAEAERGDEKDRGMAAPAKGHGRAQAGNERDRHHDTWSDSEDQDEEPHADVAGGRKKDKGASAAGKPSATSTSGKARKPVGRNASWGAQPAQLLDSGGSRVDALLSGGREAHEGSSEGSGRRLKERAEKAEAGSARRGGAMSLGTTPEHPKRGILKGGSSREFGTSRSVASASAVGADSSPMRMRRGMRGGSLSGRHDVFADDSGGFENSRKRFGGHEMDITALAHVKVTRKERARLMELAAQQQGGGSAMGGTGGSSGRFSAAVLGLDLTPDHDENGGGSGGASTAGDLPSGPPSPMPSPNGGTSLSCARPWLPPVPPPSCPARAVSGSPPAGELRAGGGFGVSVHALRARVMELGKGSAGDLESGGGEGGGGGGAAEGEHRFGEHSRTKTWGGAALAALQGEAGGGGGKSREEKLGSGEDENGYGHTSSRGGLGGAGKGRPGSRGGAGSGGEGGVGTAGGEQEGEREGRAEGRGRRGCRGGVIVGDHSVGLVMGGSGKERYVSASFGSVVRPASADTHRRNRSVGWNLLDPLANPGGAAAPGAGAGLEGAPGGGGGGLGVDLGFDPDELAAQLGARFSQLAEDLRSGSRSKRIAAARTIRIDVKGQGEAEIPVARKQLVRAGVIKALVAVIKREGAAGEGDGEGEGEKTARLEELDQVAAAILALALHWAAAPDLARAGTIPALVQVLKQGSQSAKAAAAATMYVLAKEDDFRGAVRQSGAVPLLLTVIKEGTPRGRKDAALALFAISLSTRGAKEVVSAGAIPVLLDVIGQEEDLPGLEEKAVAVLLNLSRLPEGL
ncbi:unnamed protein product [Closterium sp. Yama58-4]|nr:unnamed protein product [Closterium sp. Yama58-4]